MERTSLMRRATSKIKYEAENFIMDNVIDEVLFKILKKVKNHFGFSIIYNPLEDGMNNDMCIKEIYKWIKKYYPNYNSLFDNEQNKNSYIKNKVFFIKFSKDTYAYIATGNKIQQVNKTMSYLMNSNIPYENRVSSFSAISIYIFGKHSRKYYKELNSMLNNITSEALYSYIVSGGSNIRAPYIGNNKEDYSIREEMTVSMAPLKKREMETLFYDDRVKERVEEHINTFLETKDIYIEKDIPFKTGIMLYGDPGTGKSSLAQAIANKYKSSLVSVDMATFPGLDTTQLKESIEADDKMYIILLEDIDTLFNSLKREDDKKLDKEDKKTINKLLQFLDSPTKSPSNVVFIATTNHIENLDDAILRTGRFDIKIEVKPINKETARKMCESFKLGDSTINNILSNCTFPVVQSYLQGEILKAIKIETLKKSGNYSDVESISNRKVVVKDDGTSVIEDDSLETEELNSEKE